MTKLLRIALALLPLGVAVARRRRGQWTPMVPGPAPLRDLRRVIGVERAARRYLLYCVLPLWMVSGLLDYFWPRQTRIERTSGTHESAIHALMMTEGGVAVLIGLFFEINALVPLVGLAAVLLHELTAFWDVSYAVPRRRVAPKEQHTHSLLEMMPVMAASFACVLHWDQFRALFGWGPEQPRFRLEPKRRPLSPRYIMGLFAAIVAFVVVPYAEEFWRCYRVDRTLAPHPEPPVPTTPQPPVPEAPA